MKKTALDIHQALPTRRKRVIVVKVILAMAILLLGTPILMILAASYFTNKGIMKDAYLIGNEYTKAVTDFYNINHKCPANEDIKITLGKQDTVVHIDFTSDLQTSTCYIESRLKSLGTATDDKLIILAKTFTQQPVSNANWQCFSNVNHWFLPKECSTKLTSNDLLKTP